MKQLAEGHGVGFGVVTRPEEIESGTLAALRSPVELLEEKAPGELEAYRSFVLEVARSVAAAAPGGDTAEQTRSRKSRARSAEGRAASTS